MGKVLLEITVDDANMTELREALEAQEGKLDISDHVMLRDYVINTITDNAAYDGVEITVREMA